MRGFGICRATVPARVSRSRSRQSLRECVRPSLRSPCAGAAPVRDIKLHQRLGDEAHELAQDVVGAGRRK